MNAQVKYIVRGVKATYPPENEKVMLRFEYKRSKIRQDVEGMLVRTKNGKLVFCDSNYEVLPMPTAWFSLSSCPSFFVINARIGKTGGDSDGN